MHTCNAREKLRNGPPKFDMSSTSTYSLVITENLLALTFCLLHHTKAQAPNNRLRRWAAVILAVLVIVDLAMFLAYFEITKEDMVRC
jgi:hypothetical protein